MAGEDVRDYPRQFRPELDSGLADFLLKSCAAYREDRFATAVEMHQALQDVRSSM